MSAAQRLISEVCKLPPEEQVMWYRAASHSVRAAGRNRLLNGLLELNSESALKAAEDMVCDLMQEWSGLALGAKKEAGILLIRYLLATEQQEAAETLLQDLWLAWCDGATEVLRKRHFQLIVEHLCRTGQYEQAYRYHCDIAKYFTVEAADIIPFISTPSSSSSSSTSTAPAPAPLLRDVLSTAVGLPIEIQDAASSATAIAGDAVKIVDGAHHPLQLLKFTEPQMQLLMTALNSVFLESGQSPNLDLSVNYDYVVDGANTLMCGNKKNYSRVTGMLRTLQTWTPGAKILLVLHIRHFPHRKAKQRGWSSTDLDQIAIWETLPGVSICKTPVGFCDDYYSIINTVARPGCQLVTNDRFTDHVFRLSTKVDGLDLLKQWRKENVIEYAYDIVRRTLSLYPPRPYSFRVQRYGDTFYLPIYSEGDCSYWQKIET